MDLLPPGTAGSDTVPASLGTVVAHESLTHNAGNAATGGIWRVRGSAGTAVRKVFRPPADPPVGSPAWQTSDEPTHWNYWRREYLAYTTGLAARAYEGTGIAAPALVGAAERPDGTVELWLAEATGVAGPQWTPERIAASARQLGAAQARWVDRVPDEPWLSRRWLAQYVADRRPWVPEPVPWDHPAAEVWSDRVRRRMRPLWERRHDLVAAAEAAPRTLCHLDVWPMNLVADGPRTVLLDWAFTGEGALGEDVANLVVDSFTDGFFDPALVPEVASAVVEAYLAGLRDGGWRGSPEVVRRAVAASGAAKYAWMAPAMLCGAARGDARGGLNSYDPDSSAAQVRARRATLLDLLVQWADEATAH
ncbi:hypothetical protein ACNTMW_03515 [Planosporangium sp. 12N6]|uniref:hypothetical protein n=1 Tax=Planosporangium spinosum TaxID=3402278 RepID=UPI003CF0F8FF